MKTLNINEKWSISYDPENNDRPEKVFRYGEEHQDLLTEVPYNWVISMFYSRFKDP